MRRRIFARKLLKRDGDQGSASVEFVLLAIPLFLPIFFYITQFAEVSGREISARTLVREVVRAYVASQNLEAAEERANIVLHYGGERLGFSQNELSSMALTFSCSSSDCLTPGERVRADILLKLPISNREVHVSAQEYVSPWQ